MMDLPVTHFLYLGFALFAIGFACVLLRRSLAAVLGGVQLMVAAAVLLLCAYAHHHGDVGGQATAVLVALTGLLETAVAAAVIRRAIAGAGREFVDDWTSTGLSARTGSGPDLAERGEDAA